jgi:hypothetical protein
VPWASGLEQDVERGVVDVGREEHSGFGII